MQKYLVTFFLLASTLCGRSQRYIDMLNIDSLKKVLTLAKDTQRINTLNLLSMRILLWQEKDYLELATPYIQEAQALSEEIKYNKGLGYALLNKGIISVNRSDDFRQTLPSLQRALQLLRQANDRILVASCYGYIGDCFHHLGNNPTAILYFDSSRSLYQQLGDTSTSVWRIIDKGHSYYDLGNYSAAYKTFDDARELAPKNDTIVQAFIMGHLARLFKGAKLPEMTIEYLRKIQAYYPGPYPPKQKNIPWPLAWAMGISGEAFLQLNLVDSALKIARDLAIPINEQAPDDNLFYGNLYSAMHQYDTALVYFKAGYNASLASSHQISLARHANALAATYLNLRQFSQAIFYAKEATRIAEKIHALLEQKNAVGTLANIYKTTKNYTKAFEYGQLYQALGDSLAPEEYRRKLSLIQVQNELQTQKQQALLLSKEKQVTQQQIAFQQAELRRRSLLLYITVAALFIALLVALLAARNYKLKKRKEQLQLLMEQATAQLEQTKKEQLLTELQKEKTNLEMQVLRGQMNPHFIFNCLSSINRFILINKREEASDYLTKFSRLIRMALQHSEKALISLEAELDMLRLYLELERLRFRDAFNFSITFFNTIETSTIFIPPLLLQPFAENAIWHGLMHKQGKGNLDIALRLQGNMLHCTITDDGIGRQQALIFKSKSAEKNKSMGIQITAGRLAMLNQQSNEQAFFNIEDTMDEKGINSGTKVTLKIQYKSLTEAYE